MQHTGRLGLVRHGQTYANINRVWHGHTDTELTELGHQQARQLGEYFGNYMTPTVVYSSTLQRARITAEHIAEPFGIQVQQDARLMEFDLGDWEDIRFDDLGNGGEDIMRKLVEDPDYATPNGESQNVVKARFTAAMEDIISRHADEHIVVVAHGVALGIALSHYLDDDTRRWHHYSKNNTAFSEMNWNSKSLDSFNLTDHLKDQ